MAERASTLEDLNAEMINGFLDAVARDKPTPAGEVYFTTGQVSSAIKSMRAQYQEDPTLLRQLAQLVKIRFMELDDTQKQIFAANLAPFVRLLGNQFGKFSRNLATNSPEEKQLKAELLDLISNYVSSTKLTTEELHTRLLVPDTATPRADTYTIIDHADKVRERIANAIKRCQ